MRHILNIVLDHHTTTPYCNYLPSLTLANKNEVLSQFLLSFILVRYSGRLSVSCAYNLCVYTDN